MNKLFFANIQPGTLLFSRFEAVKCLSANVTGGVYLCKDLLRSHITVALKVLWNEASDGAEKVNELKREMLLASTIQHPHVVKSESFYQDESYTAFTMEYFENGTLAQKMEAYRDFPIQYCVRVLRQLASGLAAIHSAGIIHRDLKPENILVDNLGNVKIADFGIALTESQGKRDESDSLIGTMNYLSPEYIEKGSFDQRSDIYALGVIAYELISGRLPFKKGSLFESLTSRVLFEADSPKSIRQECPQELSNIVLRAIDRRPDRRFQTADDLLRALESSSLFAAEEPLAAAFDLLLGGDSINQVAVH